jgi:hypothetical protein
MTYLDFEDKGTSASGLTRRWVVKSKAGGILLGWIEWHAQWRRYWFCPINNTGFDAACLQEIADFLKEQMALRQSIN